MKFPSRETVVIRTVYEDTYDTLLDYVLDTSIYEGVGKVHTIWMKGKDPRKCPTCGTRITGLLSDEYNSTGSQFGNLITAENNLSKTRFAHNIVSSSL